MLNTFDTQIEFIDAVPKTVEKQKSKRIIKRPRKSPLQKSTVVTKNEYDNILRNILYVTESIHKTIVTRAQEFRNSKTFPVSDEFRKSINEMRVAVFNFNKQLKDETSTYMCRIEAGLAFKQAFNQSTLYVFETKKPRSKCIDMIIFKADVKFVFNYITVVHGIT